MSLQCVCAVYLGPELETRGFACVHVFRSFLTKILIQLCIKVLYYGTCKRSEYFLVKEFIISYAHFEGLQLEM